MSGPSDHLDEMPGDLPSDDDSFEALLAEEVRFAVSGPPPAPSPALAAVLASGFSTDKSDLLVTAASNVHGPAPQVAGLPKWRNDRHMTGSGLLTGLLSKLTSVGTLAKAAVATVTAATTATLAGGAAGVLPAPAQHVVATAIGSVSPFEFPDGDPAAVIQHALSQLPLPGTGAVATVVPPTVPDASASAGASAGTPGAGATATASAKPNVAAGTVGTPTLPGVTAPTLPAGLPGGLPALAAGLPPCVANLIPAPGTTPDPTKLASLIPACIQQVLGSVGLPTDVVKCVASVLGSLGGAAGVSPSSIAGVSNLNVGACVPMDATSCVSSVMGWFAKLPGMGGNMPGLNGKVPGLGGFTGSGIPGTGAVSGCVPLDLAQCLTSLVGGVSSLPPTGGTAVPKLDLSACMPTGATGAGAAGSLPGSGSLPFFGRR